jgi:dTDP-4-amino-4,6-dideoxygalactose transaminase
MSVSDVVRHSANRVMFEEYPVVGFNYRMTDIQAAVGLVQLTRLTEIIDERRRRADRYGQLLAQLDGLQAPVDPPHGTTNYQSYVVRLAPWFAPHRNALLARLAAEGISARRGIMAAHTEPAYTGHPHVDLPVTEEVSAGSLILPLFHGLTDADQDRVVEALGRGLHEYR